MLTKATRTCVVVVGQESIIQMRILNISQFLELPPGTVFSKYDPYLLGDLAVKGKTLDRDFFYSEASSCAIYPDDDMIIIDLLDEAETKGRKLYLSFDLLSRDGCFSDSQLFAVWDAEDIQSLIEKLQRCLKETTV